MSRSSHTSLALLALLPLAAIAQQTTTPAIADVVAAGTTIEVLKDGLEAVEGPMPMADGGVLFTNNSTRQILRVAPEGTVSTWLENSGGANALTRLPNGDVVATQTVDPAIGVMKPGEQARVLTREFEGRKFNRPNDLVANSRGDIYFTDTAPMDVVDSSLPAALYKLSARGQLTRITTGIARPNGVALSPDEKTLFVANTSGEWLIAFNVDAGGEATHQRDFAKLALPPGQNGRPATSGADGIAVDEKGRLFVATTIGIQVFSPNGEPLGVIALPKTPQNLAFGGGPQRNVLYVVGRGSVHRITMQTKGPDRNRK